MCVSVCVMFSVGSYLNICRQEEKCVFVKSADAEEEEQVQDEDETKCLFRTDGLSSVFYSVNKSVNYYQTETENRIFFS